MPAVFRAPAKINLTLEVLARREDGYHGLRSVMIPLALADELTIEPHGSFAFTCDRAELAGEDNLAVRAVRALGSPPAVRLSLRKNIPTQAGLGGGSSDAAAVLRAAMTGALGTFQPVDWLATARRLGSDVPFFLAGTGALVEATGERVTPLGALPAWHVLIVKPPAAVSTAAAYDRLDAAPRPTRARSESASLEMVAAVQRGDFTAAQRCMQNDFHDVIAAATPEIAAALDGLRRAGAGNALLAGSGSCVFTLAPQRSRVEEIGARLDLPQTYARYATAFAATPQWRS